MVDLTKLVEQNAYEIKILDGTVLHLKRPTQQMYEYMLGLADMEFADPAKTMNILSGLLARILNRNLDGRIFTAEEVSDEYDFQLMLFILQDYLSYWTKEISEKVNFQGIQ